MSGETSLAKLISSMRPALNEGTYVFASITQEQLAPIETEAIMIFREKEGTTVVLPLETAQAAGITFEFRSKLITLTVHSSLSAIGFLAAIAAELASAGISINAVSAFYHDHLFVPESKAELAISLLSAMAAGTG